jgi:phosphatidylserine decarboxylase
MGLELAWGHCRRAWLRLVRPGYVQTMAQTRQGHCPNCPHDIIDARDLKFYRNVCGYWFHPEDDAFRWRSALGLARYGLAEVVYFSILLLAAAALVGFAGALVHRWFWIALPVLLFLWFQAVFFFRDPQRVIPSHPELLLSPADGTVTHVEEVPEPTFPGGRAFRISIFLSVFNVHVNRMPRNGRVVSVRYFPGAFRDARSSACPVRNEQLWVDLEEERTGKLVRVKQISGAIARRIVCWLKAGDEVRAGDRFGMIKFGSRTDILVVAGEPMDVLVRVGDRVRGGTTALLKYRSPFYSPQTSPSTSSAT